MDRDVGTSRPPNRFAPKLIALTMVVAICTIGGCEIPKTIPGLYRIDIQQGNIIGQEMLNQLEIGMEQRKVRFILGTPLLIDPFNQDQWDYLYQFHSGSGPEVKQRISLFFADGLLVRIKGTPKSDEELGVTTIQSESLVTVPQRGEKPGFLETLTPGFLKPDATPTDDDVADDTPRPKQVIVTPTTATPSGVTSEAESTEPITDTTEEGG